MKYARVIIAPSAVRWSLAALLPSNDPILMTQHFLREAHGQREAIHIGHVVNASRCLYLACHPRVAQLLAHPGNNAMVGYLGGRSAFR